MQSANHRLKIWGLSIAAVVCLLATGARAGSPGVVLEGDDGPGKGTHIVFVIGDDEYRSEDLMPQLAKILAVRHGFKCTLLFAVDKETGEIGPSVLDNIPGLKALDTADLMVIFTRFRELPDEQMKHIIDYTNAGKPVVGLRTATHAFKYSKDSKSPYAKYSFRDKEFEGGYGRQVLGETWAGHYGHHKVESTRGVAAEGMENHPILKGVGQIWGPSDVYTISEAGLTGDSKPLVMGVVLKGMDPKDDPNPDKVAQPAAWTKTYTGTSGKPGRVFNTTMGHSFDFNCQNFRRLMVNGCYWAAGLEDKIPEKSEVDFVGKYDPNEIGLGGYKKGLKPEDHKL